MYGFQIFGCIRANVFVAAHDHLANHAGQAHALAVFGAVNAAHTVGMQFANFGGNNDTAATAKDLDVFATALAQQVNHVFEIFNVAALVGADRNALHIFLQSGCDHFVDRAVVTQVNHFSAHALQNAAHDVDRGIVAIKQAGCRDKAHFVRGAVFGEGFVFGRQVGHVKVPVMDEKGRIRKQPRLIDVYVNVNLRS